MIQGDTLPATEPGPSGFAFQWEARDGWTWLTGSEPGRFIDIYGPAAFRVEDGKVRGRVETELRHANIYDNINGGFVLAFVDLAISITPVMLGVGVGGRMVTMSAGANFIAPGRISEPLDCITEVVAETGKTILLRGFMEQGDRRIASFDGVMRKIRPRD